MSYDNLAELRGQIERVTYTNEENGYTVARVKVYGRTDLVTVVGNFMNPTPGEVIKAHGEWSTHAMYGDQFKIESYECMVPATVYGIRKYLGSGLIKGIGPVMAERIVKAFGKDTLDVIENDIQKLIDVDGIGKKRVEMIKNAWIEQKEISEVMVFLQSHGVSSAYATKIYREYGNDSISVVQENPYRLAMDIFGIGFVTTDRIASTMGYSEESEARAEAGIIYILNELSNDGHVYYPYTELVDKCQKALDVDKGIIFRSLESLADDKRIVVEELNEIDGGQNGKSVYLAKFHLCETSIAVRLKGIMDAPCSIREFDTEKSIEWVQGQLSMTLAERQVEAVRMAANRKMMVITGGPGTGKTTIIKSIISIFAALKVRIVLAAPTGRAAKRMSEATGYGAKTIHRMLEYNISETGFQRNEEDPLECDVLILDEASMIDTILMHHLLKAVPREAKLILVGDVNQLPAVGAGNVLKDIIASTTLPVVELNEIFRQAQESSIIINAHRINQGMFPVLNKSNQELDDFYFIQQEDPEKVLELLIELVNKRIPDRFGFDPVDSIQVITPMRRGIVGTNNLNKELQQSLNPTGQLIERGGRSFRINDKVMQIRNNYDKEVFNGDMGRIVKIDDEMREVTILIDDRHVLYDYSELDEIVLAYAVSVHKSQGSEYPVVVMPILTQHYILLQRNLLYTGVTRGKKLVVLIGSRKALAIAVRNNKTQARFTYLDERLKILKSSELSTATKPLTD